MTTAEVARLLESHTERLRRRLVPWVERVSKAIEGKIDDAAAHALKAITETLRRTPDGRLTDQRALKNPSFLAAMARLDELLTLLTGPSNRSLDGLLRDARESFYIGSFAIWKTAYEPDALISPDPVPTQIGKARVKATPTHGGIDMHAEWSTLIQGAKDDLRRAVNAAASTDSLRTTATDRIDTWRRQKTAAMIRAASLELSDGDMMAHNAAMVDIVKADLR